MELYQTVLYKAVKSEIGWAAVSQEILFESGINSDPTVVMQELNSFVPKQKKWIAAMRVIKNAKIISEDSFDSSVIEMRDL